MLLTHNPYYLSLIRSGDDTEVWTTVIGDLKPTYYAPISEKSVHLIIPTWTTVTALFQAASEVKQRSGGRPRERRVWARRCGWRPDAPRTQEGAVGFARKTLGRAGSGSSVLFPSWRCCLILDDSMLEARWKIFGGRSGCHLLSFSQSTFVFILFILLNMFFCCLTHFLLFWDSRWLIY
jgi:hypothetical protein